MILGLRQVWRILCCCWPSLGWAGSPRQPCPVIAHSPKAPAHRGPAPGTSVPVGLTHSPLEQTWELVGQSRPHVQQACVSFQNCFLVQLLSCVQLFVTPWTAACQASLSITNCQSLLKLMSIESVILSNHLILSRPLLFLPSSIPSIRVFSSESALPIRWPKYWSISFSISPSNEYSGLISFKTDWFDLLAVQGTLKSLLQHHNLKVSILCINSAFFMVQHSHPYMTTGKTIALTR